MMVMMVVVLCIRYLTGILPTCLIEGHKYWLDDNDNLRGYPDAKDEKSGLYEHVILVEVSNMSPLVVASWRSADLSWVRSLSGGWDRGAQAIWPQWFSCFPS